jgi:RES domain-containing protein
MILTDLGPDAPFYRAFTPQWAHAPESGAGAAVRGGRFNRPGLEARYLASTAAGALLEYQGESPLLPPATVASFLVTARNIVDFTGGFHADGWRGIWAEAYCNWKMLAFVEDTEPPSWVIGDLVELGDRRPRARSRTSGNPVPVFTGSEHYVSRVVSRTRREDRFPRACS